MSNNFFKNLGAGIKTRIGRVFKNPYKEVNVNWLKLKYYKHISGKRLRTHKLFERTLYFYSAQELLHGLKEIFLEKIYKQQLSETAYIIDCGANIGMSIISMKQQYPRAEILAFEPDEANFELLEKNIKSFGYTGVTTLKQAVWDANVTLQFSNDSSMGSRVEEQAGSNTREVKAVRLKDYLNRKVDFLKIDIEGAENVVLFDVADQLHNVNNMFLEYHGTFEQNKDLTNIINIINNAGFNFYIREAAPIYDTPFFRTKNPNTPYDVQLNIFCFRDKTVNV